ncbi:MAG: glycosyltransferase family 39 protein [Armatimonadota bacterium]
MSDTRQYHANAPAPAEATAPRRLRVCLLAVGVIAALAHVLGTMQPVFTDEFLVLGNFWDYVQNRTIIPEHTNYPAFFSYMVAPANALFFGASIALGLPPSIYDFSEWMMLRPELGMWPARLVSTVCWAVCAWAVYRLALETIGARRAAAIAAAAFASAFGLLEYSGYGLPDIAMMMWTTLSLVYALQILRSERPVRDAAIGGGLAGLAMATKYSAIAIAPALLAAILLARVETRGVRLRMLGAMAGVAVAAFIVACPGWILAPGSYWSGLAFERAHMAKGHLGFFGAPVLGQLELLFEVDPVLLIAGLAGAAAWALRGSRRRALLLLAIAGAGVFAMAAPAKKQSLQYIFTLYPLLAVFTAGGLEAVTASYRRPATALLVAALLLTASWGLVWGYRVALLPDSLVLGRQWINARVPADATIAVDWIDVPRLISEDELETLRSDLRTEMVRNAYEGLRGFETVKMANAEPSYRTREFLQSTPATWLVTSSTCYDRFFEFGRFTRLPPPEDSQLRGEFLLKRDFYHALRDGYAGWKLEHEVFTGNGPTVRIYRRADAAAPLP